MTSTRNSSPKMHEHPIASKFSLPKKIALAVHATLIFGAFGMAMPLTVHAGNKTEASVSRHYNIAAGTLSEALTHFAKQASITLSFTPQQVQGLRTAGLNGDYTVESGLATLLSGSALSGKASTGGYVLVAIPASQKQAPPKPQTILSETELPEVVVMASEEKETAIGPVVGYVAKRSASGTKTDTTIVETPQSVSVVTNDELRDRQAETLSQALSYTPGFTSQPTSFNRTADRFRIRGFDVESATSGSLRDGLRLQNNSYDGIQEPFGLERVEAIRGAASVLYGQLSPGGMVNGVSKRPTEIPLHELNVQFGENDRKQLSADFSGPIGESDTLSYRLTMLGRDSNTAQDHIDDDRVYIAPALTWRPSDDTSLTLLSFYQKTDTRFSAPLPYQLVKGVGDGAYKIGRHDFIGEPDYDEMSGEMYAVGYEFEHRFNESNRISHKLRYYESDVTWNYLQAQTSPAALNNAMNTGILARQYSDRHERSRGVASDTNIESKWQFLGMEHTFLAGLDAYSTSYNSHNFRGAAPALDLSTYADGQPIVVNKDPNFNRGSKIDTTQKGIYLQDQIKFNDKLIVLLGGRHDWAEQEQELHRDSTKMDQDNEATTWRAGLVYKADNGLAPYISYSESFFPISAADAAGEAFSPTEGKQYEIGIRYQPEGSNLLLSAAVYELTQTNVLKYDIGTDTFRQTGEMRSRGFELEAKADVTPELSVIASYAYTDARITKSTISAEVNQRSEDTPYHQAALWTGYSFARFGMPQLKVGAGARYKGTTQASGIESAMPAYTLFDAMASYQVDQNWELTVNANNLTNKKYTYCEFAICRYGDERQATGTLSYRW